MEIVGWLLCCECCKHIAGIAANRPGIPLIVPRFGPPSGPGHQMSRDFLVQTNATERVDSEVEVIHTFRPDSNNLSSYFLACGLVASVFYSSCMQLQ